MSSSPFKLPREHNFQQIYLFLNQGELKEFVSCFESNSFGYIYVYMQLHMVVYAEMWGNYFNISVHS